MFSGFEKIIEARIKKAQEQGVFENLPGSGQPLELSDDQHIPEDLRMAHKVLKNADCLPPEVQLRKDIRTTEDMLIGMTDTTQKYRILKKLNFLILKLNATRNADAARDIPQHYIGEMVERFESDKS